MNSDRHVIIVFHGTRLSSAVQDAREFVRRISSNFPDHQVYPAFLQFAEPFFLDSLERAASAKARSIFVLPMFVLNGRHTEVDLMQVFSEFRRNHPEIALKVSTAFVEDPSFFKWLTAKIRENS